MKRVLISQTPNFIEQKIRVCGWVNSFRTHGKIIFIDLRDRSGLLQVTFAKDTSSQIFDLAKRLKPEWVVEIIGKVKRRPKGTENPELITGEIESVSYTHLTLPTILLV